MFSTKRRWIKRGLFFEALNSDIHKISIELISSINPNATSQIVDIILKRVKSNIPKVFYKFQKLQM